ncbi:two-component system, NarL family, sensor histidine kinase UhpB [Pararobbsia alpina]|uniref:PAS domain-containing sensor histidine kinase n=1 Tax=Pararobbsia alpina TaxID=621374 RepID=UPI0039A53ECC
MNTTPSPAPSGDAPPANRTLELFIEAVEDYAIFMLDADGNVASWNNGAQKIKGYRPDEIIGRHFSIFYSDEDLVARKPQFELDKARLDGRVEDEGWRLRKDGSRFWANVVITAVSDKAGKLVGFAKVTRDMTERIRMAELERSRAVAAQSHIAREDEQRRIARELHDDLGQQLVALKMDLSLLQKSLSATHGDGVEIERMTRLETRIDALVGSVRRIAADLRPPLLDDLGLPAAIEWIANDVEQRHGFAVVPDIEVGDFEFHGPAASSLFRVVQEALNNAVRHAHATHVAVRLFADDDALHLHIEDNGVGAELGAARSPSSFGLLGMGERVHMLGGTITFHSEPGSGFAIRVSIPIGQAGKMPGSSRA